ncbi:MAG: hypothetical protein GX608_00115 [Lentisphaerae bacterium]|nr:hypothetical protein [Lentisphaerota bacterium]
MKVTIIPSRASALALFGFAFLAFGAIRATAASETVVQVSEGGAVGRTILVGQEVTIQVTFSGNVWVSNGVPYIELRLTNSGQLVTGRAWYQPGTDGDAVLDFKYTVEPGHLSTNLNYISIYSLILPGSTYIGDDNNNMIDKTLPVVGGGNDLGHQRLHINGLAPIRAMSTNGSSKTYTVGDNIRIGLVFPDAVWVDDSGGTPSLTLATAGVQNRDVSWTDAGDGTSTQFFDYVVQAGDYGNPLNYLSVDALKLNGAVVTNIDGFSITDGEVNNVKLPPTHDSANSLSSASVKVSAPVVTNVTSPDADSVYGAFTNITIFVQFSEPVTVAAGRPTLTLATEGYTNRVATCQTAVGIHTQSMRFQYDVYPGDQSGKLDYLATNSLQGSITEIGMFYPADNTLPIPGDPGSLSKNKNIKIETEPVVTNVTSTSLDGGYGVGAVIPIQVSFSKPVTNVAEATLKLEVGASSNVYAYCPAGESGTHLTFTYTVGPGQFTVTNMSYSSGKSLEDQIIDQTIFAYPVTANPPTPGTFRSLSYNKALIIDTVPPYATNYVPRRDSRNVVSNQVLMLDFNENIVTGGVGGTINIRYQSNSNLFEAIDISSTNLVISNNHVEIHHTNLFSDIAPIVYFVEITNTLREARQYVFGVTNYVNWTSPTNWRFTSVDTWPPFVTNVTSDTPDDFYTTGAVIQVQLQFTENITMDTSGGTPTVELGVGPTGQVGAAQFVALTNDYIMLFEYEVQPGDFRTNLDYASTNSFQLNGAVVKDLSGSNAVLALPDVGSTNSLSWNKEINLDTIPPKVKKVTSVTPDDYYSTGSVINVEIEFDEAITNVGPPRLDLNTTPLARAKLTNQPNDFVLQFGYTVSQGENSPRLDYAATNSLHLNSATILDRAGNAADLTLPQPSWLENRFIVIDTALPIPTVSSGNGRPTRVAPIPFDVTFNEDVTDFGIDGLIVENGKGTNFAGLGSNYSLDVTPFVQGGVTVTVAAAAARDRAGNWNSNSAPFVRIYDTVEPTPVMAWWDASLKTTNSPIMMTVTFDEYVTNFTASSLRVTNGIVSEVVTNNIVIQYGIQVSSNFTCSISPVDKGPVRVHLDAGAAYDIAGNPCQAALKSLTKNYEFPAPGGLQASDGTHADRVRLNWTGIPGTFDFQVIRSLYADAVFGEVIATVGTTNYDDLSAAPGTLSYYWVRAVSTGGGFGPESNPDTGWRNLAPPANVAASLGTFTNLIHIGWSASEGATGYRVYRSTVSNSASATQVGVTDNTMFEDFSAGVGAMYYWIKATNALALSDFSVGTTGSRVSFADALNNTQLSWASGGDAIWFGQTLISHDGLHSAQSGNIGDSQVSWMRTVVDIKGTLSFWWRVDCETNYDFVRFYVDGAEVASLTGEMPETQWEQVKYSVASGVHTLQWAYVKDQSRSAGLDAAWVDELSFIEVPRNLAASDGAYANKIRVMWSGAFTEGTTYRVLRGTTPIQTAAQQIGAVSGATWFEDLAVDPGQVYYYWVIGENKFGASYAAGPEEGHARGVQYDFDGDGRADLAVYHRSSDRWHILTPSGQILAWNMVGVSTNPASAVLTPADYDGDGRTDIGVYQPESGAWFAKSLASGAMLLSGEPWGGGDAIPLPADYDGDGRADQAVYFPSMNTWYILTRSGAIHAVPWGSSSMTPCPGDYDGDSRTDLGVFDHDKAMWYVISLTGQVLAWDFNWGWHDAALLPADYNGDGLCDFAVRDAATARWYIISIFGGVIAWNYGWGWSDAIAVPADYTGDGRTDLAVYQPSDGMWYIWAWPGYIYEIQWGWYEAVPGRIGE